MIGRHYIYGIDYVSGPFSEVVDFIEDAHNDKSAVLIGFAPMTSAAIHGKKLVSNGRCCRQNRRTGSGQDY